jgi:hypothetical protein
VFFGVWWALSAVYTVPYIRKGRAMRTFCADVLGLADEDVATESWPAIMKRLATVCGGCASTAPSLLAQMSTRLLRRENYWTALYACHSLRGWRLGPGPLDLSTSSILYHVLDTCCVQATAGPEFVATGRLLPVAVIQRRIWACAAVLVLALPFMLPFLVTRGVLKYMPEVHLHRTHPRGFSHAATWAMRDFNEPWLALETRRARAAGYAAAFLACFVQPVFHAVVTVLVMVARFALGLLILLAITDEDILGAVTVGSHNLLWCMGILTAVVALAPPTRISETDAGDAFAKLSSAMHYTEPHWWTSPHGFSTSAAIRALCPLRLWDAAGEAAAMLLAPLTLVAATATSPRLVETLVDSIRSVSTRLDSVGVVCRPAAEAAGLHGSKHPDPDPNLNPNPNPDPNSAQPSGSGFGSGFGSMATTTLASETLLRDKTAKSALAFEIVTGQEGPYMQAALAEYRRAQGACRDWQHIAGPALDGDLWFHWAEMSAHAPVIE